MIIPFLDSPIGLDQVAHLSALAMMAMMTMAKFSLREALFYHEKRGMFETGLNKKWG